MSLHEHQDDLASPCLDTTENGVVFESVRCLRCCDQRRGVWVTLPGLPEEGETYALSTGGTLEVLRVSYAVAPDAKLYLGPQVTGVEASGQPFVGRFCCEKVLGCVYALWDVPGVGPVTTQLFVQVGLAAAAGELSASVWVKLAYYDGGTGFDVFWFDWRRDITAVDDYEAGSDPARNKPYESPLCVLPLGLVSPLQNTPSGSRISGVIYMDDAPATMEVLPVGLNSDGSSVILRGRDGGYVPFPTSDDPLYCACSEQRLPSKVWVTVSGLTSICTPDSHLTFAADSVVVEVPLFGGSEPEAVCFLDDSFDSVGMYSGSVSGLALAACGEGENICIDEGSPSGLVEVYVDQSSTCYFEDYSVKVTVRVTLACSAEPGSTLAYAYDLYFRFACSTGIVPADTAVEGELLTSPGLIPIGTLAVNVSHDPPP